MSGFILEGKRYTWVSLAEVALGDQIRVERWMRSADITDARSWEDVLAIAREVNSLGSFEEQARHPEFKLAFVLTMWAARRGAGESVTAAECLDLKPMNITFWSDDEDEDEDDDEGKAEAVPEL